MEKCDIIAPDKLRSYCRSGQLRLIKQLEDKYSVRCINWSYGLRGACRGGHREIVDFLIAKGACDWDSGLNCACYGDQYEIAQFMLAKGANPAILNAFPYIKAYLT